MVVARRIALYGLLIFYGLTKEELQGRKPLAKFMAIKLIVMFTFYQTFVVRTRSLPSLLTSFSTSAVLNVVLVSCSSARWRAT